MSDLTPELVREMLDAHARPRALPICAMDGCGNVADPRWYQPCRFGHKHMICDGHSGKRLAECVPRPMSPLALWRHKRAIAEALLEAWKAFDVSSKGYNATILELSGFIEQLQEERDEAVAVLVDARAERDEAQAEVARLRDSALGAEHFLHVAREEVYRLRALAPLASRLMTVLPLPSTPAEGEALGLAADLYQDLTATPSQCDDSDEEQGVEE